jgi:hypothetical protein
MARAKYGAVAAANSNLAHSTSNVAAQFQDIAVQIAGGQSLLTIALQQGTQLTYALGERGTGGALKGLAAGFMSLLSPMSLATVGLIAVGGYAAQYVTSLGEVESLDDRLRNHAPLIKSLRDSYGEAGKAAVEYANEASRVLEVQLQASRNRLDVEFGTLSRSLAGRLSSTMPSLSSIEMGAPDMGGVIEAERRYAAFSDAIVRLRQEADRGEPSIRNFRDSVAAIAQGRSDDARVQALAEELLKLSKDAFEVEKALSAAQRAMMLTGDAAGASLGNLKAYGCVEAAGPTRVAEPTDREKAARAFRSAIAEAGGAEDRLAARRAYDESLARIAAREGEQAAKRAARAAGRSEPADDYDRMTKRAEDQIRRLSRASPGPTA